MRKKEPCRKRRRNAGWFQRGHDARRSTYRFTPSDCRVGWWVANILHPHLRDYLRMKLWVFYSTKRRKEQARGNSQASQAAGGEAAPRPPGAAPAADPG